jgi:hypothetical protein
MINKANFVYSKAAAARILNVSVYAIARLEKWAWVCFVQVKGQRPIFMSFKVFKAHFADWRKQQSSSLCVSRVEVNHYRVVNPKKGTAYNVFVEADGLDCECEDYKNQVAILKGRVCCKHSYAVLTWLGCDRLSDYLDRRLRVA